jgi:hypothetical protein
VNFGKNTALMAANYAFDRVLIKPKSAEMQHLFLAGQPGKGSGANFLEVGFVNRAALWVIISGQQSGNIGYIVVRQAFKWQHTLGRVDLVAGCKLQVVRSSWLDWA